MKEVKMFCIDRIMQINKGHGGISLDDIIKDADTMYRWITGAYYEKTDESLINRILESNISLPHK